MLAYIKKFQPAAHPAFSRFLSMKRSDPAPCSTAIDSAAAPRAQLLSRSPYSAVDPARTHSLGIALERQRGVHAIGSDRREDFDTWPGTLAYTPVGVDVFSESEAGGEYLVVRWSNGDDGAPLQPGSAERPRLYWTGHARALRAAQHLRTLLLAPAPDALAVEQTTWAFVSLMDPGDAGRTHAPTEPQLRRVYGRVLERIASDFAQPLTIAELAQAEGKAPLQFLREFTRQVGMTPHAFIVETRVQAARAMMRNGAESLASIAMDCGFSHQSHMGAAFRRALGQTPRQYTALAKRPTGA